MADQYLRKIGLAVYGAQASAANANANANTSNASAADQQGIDLAPEGGPPLRIIFNIDQFDAATPNTAIIRVINLSRETAQRVRNEFQKVTLQAGYEGGNYGVIFQGTIKQIKTGRINNTDTFLDIFAADADIAHNFAMVNKTLAAGSSVKDRADAVVQAMNPYLDQQGLTIPDSAGTGGVLPRDKVLFGLAASKMSDLSDTIECSWSIQNGRLVMVSRTAYLAGEAVVINAQTGMIGVPEATNNGIEVSCLLNPNIKIGTRIQLDNASINQTKVVQQGFPRYSDVNFFANTNADGIYRPIVVRQRGDTWGTEWYTAITCLSLDASQPAGDSVKPT